jgi:CheY-like chemotaxis protein
MARVLVIDDDKDIATTTSLMLEQGGHTVEVELVENNALAHVDSMKPDCLVLDVMFPGNSEAGFELSRAIRAKHPKLPIIMVTSVNDYSTLKFSNKDIDGSWLPIDQFVNKPIKKQDLLGMVSKLTGK